MSFKHEISLFFDASLTIGVGYVLKFQINTGFDIEIQTQFDISCKDGHQTMW